MANPISTNIDFERDGLQHGFLKIPHSRNDSAWGSVMLPISYAKNGDGPGAILTGANHGDEYEGPVALVDLALKLEPSQISGRVIIVPALNYPAFRAATRTSPIDRGNMNRSFPGKPDGTVSEKIADYFNSVLLPQADIVIDFHSGGKTLDFLPFACAHILDDKQQQAQCVAAVRAFNAPYTMMLLEIDNVGMYDSAVEDQGKIFVTTELGGGGSATTRSIAIAKKGLRNVLKHSGIIKGEPEIAPTIMLDMPDGDCFVFCQDDGLLEPMFDLGDMVNKGEIIARVWPADRTGRPPVDYPANRSGILASRHFPGLIKSGDCLAVVAVIVDQ
jgi:N-alpha-acetyl-L-2,4-diaminobutyrate deacetylase